MQIDATEIECSHQGRQRNWNWRASPLSHRSVDPEVVRDGRRCVAARNQLCPNVFGSSCRFDAGRRGCLGQVSGRAVLHRPLLPGDHHNAYRRRLPGFRGRFDGCRRPYVRWLTNTAAQAEEVASQARAAASAFETAFAATVPPAHDRGQQGSAAPKCGPGMPPPCTATRARRRVPRP